MKLVEALNLSAPGVVALVGGGGKTSLMYRLAEEIPAQHRVLLTTTTKIFVPPPEKHSCFCVREKGCPQDCLFSYLESGGRPVLGLEKSEGNKLLGLEPSFIDKLLEQGATDFVLVEADGSKGLPLKGHLEHEPVIPGAATHLVVVVGADALGRRLDSHTVHRPPVVAELTGQAVGSRISPATIARLLTHPQGVLRNTRPEMMITVVINKADCLKSLDEAYQTAKLLLTDDRIRQVMICSVISPDPVIDILKA